MIRWTTSGQGNRFALLVHHTDAEREWAYDRDSPIGRLGKTLEDAEQRGWIVASIRDDWRRVFSFEKRQKK